MKKFKNISTKNVIRYIVIAIITFSTFEYPYSWAVASAKNNLRVPLQLSKLEYKKRVLDLLEIAISNNQEAVIPFDVSDMP